MILPALNSNYNELSTVLRFELPQLREYMDAVDSPIGPEVEKDDFTPELSEGQLSASSMDPVEFVGKFGSPHRRCGSELSGHNILGQMCLIIRVPHDAAIVCARKLL